MFNMLNARKVEDEFNVLAGIFSSHVFWVIWMLISGFQVWQEGGGGGGGGGGGCAWSCKRLAAPSHAPCHPPPNPPTRQVIIMFFLGGIFKVEHLTGLEWLVSMLVGLGSLPVALLTKVVAT